MRHTTGLVCALGLSLSATASAQDGPFFAIEPLFNEMWKLACWDKATLQMVAADCLAGGRYAMSGKYSRWTAEWMREVDQAVPAKTELILQQRERQAARQNLAYRTLRARNIAHNDALVLCQDKETVTAIINSLAGLQKAPDIVIEHRNN